MGLNPSHIGQKINSYHSKENNCGYDSSMVLLDDKHLGNINIARNPYIGPILWSHGSTHWWCKIQDLIKHNRKCHKYHHSQNYWKYWVLINFEVTDEEGEIHLLINIKHTLIVAYIVSPSLTTQFSTSLVFCKTNFRYYQYKA